MSKDSFGSFSTPVAPDAPSPAIPKVKSPARESFGSFQEYKSDAVGFDTAHSAGSVIVEEAETVLASVVDNVLDVSTGEWSHMLKFIDPNVFQVFNVKDQVSAALESCFSYTELIGMPGRSLVTAEEAISSGHDPLSTLIKSQSWSGIAQYTK